MMDRELGSWRVRVVRGGRGGFGLDGWMGARASRDSVFSYRVVELGGRISSLRGWVPDGDFLACASFIAWLSFCICQPRTFLFLPTPQLNQPSLSS